MLRENITFSPLGDTAIIIHLGNVVDEEINRQVMQIAESLSKAQLTGVQDIVPAYSSVTVHYNMVLVYKASPHTSTYLTMLSMVSTIIDQQEFTEQQHEQNIIKVPVCYDEEFSLDLYDIAAFSNSSIDEVVQMHISKTYRVYMIGFLPGFAYMGEVDEKIVMPRKAEPRGNVVAGSVGIAGKQTGIYPLASPGGWQIIGRTPLQLFSVEREPPSLFKPGDIVEFYPITKDEFDNY